MRSFIACCWALLVAPQLLAQSTSCPLVLVHSTSSEMIALGNYLTPQDTLATQDIVYALSLKALEGYLSDSSDFYAASIRFQPLNRDSFLVTQDRDGDHDFEEEPSHILTKSNALPIEYAIFTKDQRRLLAYKASLRIEDYQGTAYPVIQSFLKFHVLQTVIPEVDSIIYYPHPALPRFFIHSRRYPDLQKRYVITNEPFRVGRQWYVLERADVLHQQVSIRALGASEKPYGYLRGHYVQLDRLREQVNRAAGEEVMSADQPRYTLHHFWGPWCGPCMAEVGAVKALEERLANSNVQVIHHCFLFNRKGETEEQLRSSLAAIVEEGQVNAQQAVLILPDPDPDKAFCRKTTDSKFIHGCHPVDLLNINGYPSYVLIDPEGKILYRDGRAMNDKRFFDLLEKVTKTP